MKRICGISSQVFFSVAAVTGCISVIVNMTLIDPPLESGGITGSRTFTFGPTYVVKPKGKHQATIVWLHGLGDDGSSWSPLLETLPFPNGILFINGDILTALENKDVCNCKGFDVTEISEDASQDVEGMDASAAHVMSLLSTEPPNIKLGVGGFSMGAAVAIYSAICFGHGKFGNGTGYSIHLDAVIGLSGWLPCAKNLSNKVEGYEVEVHAASLPILLCHGKGDNVVRFCYGEKSAKTLTLAGFENVTFKSFNSLGHSIIPEELDVVSSWLTSNLGLEGES